MKTQIQSLHFNADIKLLDFINVKMDKLERFDEHISSGSVILSIDKDNEAGNKLVLTKVVTKGGELVSERRAKSFEEAFDATLEAIRKQIERHRGQ